MTTLHDQIMNIPLGNGVSSGAGELVAYKTGHRDARHVAAEIAIASDARIEALEAALQKIIDMNVQYCYDRYGDVDKAESMACVRVARDTLKGQP